MDLSAVLDIIKRRRWLIVMVSMVGVALAALVLWMTPKEYQATSQVLVMGPRAGGAPVTTNIDMQLLAASTAVVEGMQRDLHTNESLASLQNRITAKVNFGSDVIPISFMDTSRSEAVLGANAAAVELSRYYRQIAFSRFNALTAYLQKQMTIKQQQIQVADQKLRQAAVKDPYNADADAAVNLAARIVQLQQQRDGLQATVIGDQAEVAAENQHIAEITPIIDEEKFTSDPVFQKLRAQESTDAAQLAIEQADYKTTYPGLAGLRAQVAQEKRELAVAEARALRSPTTTSPSYVAALSAKGDAEAKAAADNAQLTAIDSEISQTEDRLVSVSGGGQIGDLRRQRDLLLTEYQALAAQMTSAVAAGAEEANVGSIAVIDQARSATPTLDKHAVLAIVGSLLGFLIAGLALAFVIEVLDVRVRTVAGVESLYGRPVLGTVTPK